jgi:hypothetical protein
VVDDVPEEDTGACVEPADTKGVLDGDFDASLPI